MICSHWFSLFVTVGNRILPSLSLSLQQQQCCDGFRAYIYQRNVDRYSWITLIKAPNKLKRDWQDQLKQRQQLWLSRFQLEKKRIFITMHLRSQLTGLTQSRPVKNKIVPFARNLIQTVRRFTFVVCRVLCNINLSLVDEGSFLSSFSCCFCCSLP